MGNLLLVSPDRTSLASLEKVIRQKKGFKIHWAKSGSSALAAVQKNAYVLAVVDEDLGDMTGLELVRRFIAVNPMLNCAIVSGLEHKAFHEASEGLGILIQLPVQPGEQDAVALLQHLNRILNLTNSLANKTGDQD